MCIHCVSSRSKDSLSVVVFCYMLLCVGCFGLVVSTCQVIGWKDPSEDTLTWWRDIPPQSPGGRECLCIFFFCLFVRCSYVFPPALHNIHFLRLWHDIAHLCWKCCYTPTKQNKSPLYWLCCHIKFLDPTNVLYTANLKQNILLPM